MTAFSLPSKKTLLNIFKTMVTIRKFEEEIARDVVHGFLHLMGYDHEASKRAEAEMISLQESIIKLITKDK